MNRAWPSAALALESTLRDALDRLGGVDLTRSAEDTPGVRTDRLEPVLSSLGVLQLDAFGEEEEAAAAALAVRACGATVAPYPIAHALAVPPEQRDSADAIYVVDGPVTHLDHADVFRRPVATGLDDGLPVRAISPLGPPRPAPLDPFGVPVRIGPPSAQRGTERAVHMAFVLDAFWVAGALATISRQATEYAVARHQFGRPIAQFGEIRWRISDIAVATDGLDELCAYTWFLVRRNRATNADALALRVAMIEAADVVLKNGHQVFAAIGLCEEHDLAVIDRQLTSVMLRPAGSNKTASLLLRAVNEVGFDAIFPVPPRTRRAKPPAAAQAGRI